MLIAMRYFLVFILYSFLGWSCEVVYCSIPAKKLINRGFLAGPVCPIYGVGALLVVHLLTPVAENPVAIFVCGAVLTSALEYATSFLLEKLFHTKLWDYSQRKWNIHGRVCLLNSSLFGLMSLLVMDFIHPLMLRIVGALSDIWLIIASSILFVLFLADTMTTVRTMLLMNKKLEKIHETLDEMREKLGDLGWEQNLLARERIDEWLSQKQALSDEIRKRLEGYRDKIRQTALSKRLGQRRILKAFPTMKSPLHSEALQNLRDALMNLKDKKKK